MPIDLDRRSFAALTTGGALGLILPGAASAQQNSSGMTLPNASFSPQPPKFPDGFVWGTATAAYQIEGSPDADGKGKSIWDIYAHTPGKIRNGDTGDVADDHYRRYKEDVALMKDIGIGAYRFSISWARIFPEGIGKPNQKGLDFYKRLVAELRGAGIEPFVTLYHWDLPQALQDKGGWQSRDTAKAFGDYAGFLSHQFGDGVRNYFTLNEFQNFVDMGYQGVDLTVQGKPVRIELAPGLKLSQGAVNQVAHHAVLAHGLAVQAIRASAPAGTRVGPAEVLSVALPAIDAPEHVRAAEMATRHYNERFLDVMLTGKYSDAYLTAAGKDAPKFTDADLRAIASPLDYVGVNIYVPKSYVLAADTPQGYRELPMSVSHPKMGSSWHSFSPEVLYWGPRFVHSLWRPKEIYITENGCAADDAMQPDGQVYDLDRIMYLRAMLSNLQRAIAEGVPVKGNFVWSLMDNFEWSNGYGDHFGLVHVDFKTQKRTPKLSAQWFKRAAMANAIV